MKFGSKLKDKRRSSLLPMVMPPVDGVLERWDFYEKKSAGNPQQDQPHLLKTNHLNFDNYLYKSPNKVLQIDFNGILFSSASLPRFLQILIPWAYAIFRSCSFETAYTFGNCEQGACADSFLCTFLSECYREGGKQVGNHHVGCKELHEGPICHQGVGIYVVGFAHPIQLYIFHRKGIGECH